MNRIVIALLKPFSFIPAILMMSMIFSFSSQNGTESSQFSEKVARSIFITIDHVMDRGWDDEKIQELADEYQYPVRKLAHMTEYCLLAIAISFPLYVYGVRGIWLILLAGAICVGFAGFDEYHQSESQRESCWCRHSAGPLYITQAGNAGAGNGARACISTKKQTSD